MTARAVLLLALAAACGPPPPPLETLQRTGYRELSRGDIAAARAAASEGLRRASPDPEWEKTFRVLEAEVLLTERRVPEALARLDGMDTSAGVLKARLLMTRAVARCLRAGAGEPGPAPEVELAQAAALAATLGAEELAGEIALRHGTCRGVQGDNAGAEVQFRHALAVGRSLSRPLLEAHAMGSLGLLRARAGRYDDAADWLSRALTLAESEGAVGVRAKIQNNLGWCRYRLGDFEGAVRLLSDAESTAARLGLAGDRLMALIHLGNASYLTGDAAAAESHYDRALELARALGDEATAAQLLVNLGAVAIDRGFHEIAESRLRDGLRASESLGLDDVAHLSRLNLGHSHAARKSLDEAEALYRSVSETPSAAVDQRWEAAAGLASLYVTQRRSSEAETEFRRAFAFMDAFRSAVQGAEHRITFFATLRRFHVAYVDFLAAAGRTVEALEAADGSRARLLQEQPGATPGWSARRRGAYADLARGLGATLLSYWTAPERSYLWVVTPSGVVQHTLPGDAELRRDVERLQARILRSRDPLAERVPEAERLFRVLVAPAGEAVRAGRIVLIPDGPLHQLNFETLVVPAPTPHYWIEDVTVAITPALGVLRPPVRGARSESARSVLVVGDPLPATEFPALPYARREVDGIARLFGAPRSTVRAGAEAHPAAYRESEPRRYAFIHFAAHVTASAQRPLDSAVVLSPHGDDFKLYAREIHATPIEAELVTLSACRSAGARAYAGEGLVGLAWAFLHAGAGNVVGGLWNVEDSSTASLMALLYERVARGMDPASALREAKLELLRSATAHRKPYYWAPFVMHSRWPGARARFLR